MNISNFPTTDNEYEYTDEDFIRDTQPCWVAFELEQEREMQEITDKYIDEFYANPDNQPEPIVYDDEEDEEDDEPDPYRKLPSIGFDWGRLDDSDRMNLLDTMRDDESGLYDENPYDYDDMSPDEADWRFDNLEENRTPEGWFGDDD